MIIGIRQTLAIVVGCISVLLGLIGLALLLVFAKQPVPERGRFRHILLVIGSILLVAGGGLVLLGVGIIYPLEVLKFHLPDQLEVANRLRCAQAVQAILGQPKYQDPKKLNRHEYRVFSQSGEDGIIAEIFRRIGITNRYFVEFGSSNGFENNTVLLLRQGWSGFWIDGNHAAVSEAREHFRPEIESKRLTVMQAFITAENIEDFFRQGKVPEEFDLLSIDIDRNDYYVWEKISHYRPRAVVIEYNALFPPTMSWVIPYDPKAMWDITSRTGASLKALEELGTKKGYSLVGCNISGVNAFFIRNDLLDDRFAAPYTAENYYEPARHDLFWHDSYPRRVP